MRHPAEPPPAPAPYAYRGVVTRSPLALAALATVAVPGLDAIDVRRPRHPSAGTDAAIVIDAEGRRWVVRAPQSPAAGAALEAEVGLLAGLGAHVDAGLLPFDVPRPAGFVDLPEGGRAVVHPQLPGRPLRLEDLGPGPGLAAEVGRAIAAIHELPPETVEDAGLPVYEADAYRQRRLAEVDEAARTGRVPTGLLRRWEHALEDVAMWRFRPVMVHGDLSADHVLCSADRPVAVLGWSEAKVADPADDLAWLLVAAPHEGVDAILEAYTMRRTEMRDPHLADRALLAGELALARWLLHGVRLEDEAIIDDATAMLVELAEHTQIADDVAVVPGAAGLAAADDGADVVPWPEPEAEAVPELAAADDGAGVEPEAESEQEAESEAEQEAEAEPEREPEAGHEPEAEQEAEAESEADAGTEREPESEAEAEPEREPEAGHEPEAEPEAEARPEPAEQPALIPAFVEDVTLPAVVEDDRTPAERPAGEAEPPLTLWDRILDAEEENPPAQPV